MRKMTSGFIELVCRESKHGLCWGHFASARRQLGSFFCQVFSPIAVIIILVLLQSVVRDEAEGLGPTYHPYMTTTNFNEFFFGMVMWPNFD